jgi:hypothetical protein
MKALGVAATAQSLSRAELTAGAAADLWAPFQRWGAFATNVTLVGCWL